MKPWLRQLFLVLFVLAICLGIFARFYKLGVRQLAEDEYYFIQSVHFILDKGVPAFPEGGYYERGLPFQYLTALSILTFGDNGFAYRLPTALTSLLCIFLCYLLAKRHLGIWPACSIVVALLLSSWHVEFARFARMYMPFQAVTLGVILALPLLQSQSYGRRALPLLLVAISPLIHKLGVILGLVLLAYELGNAVSRRKISLFNSAGVIFSFGFVFLYSSGTINIFDQSGSGASPELAVDPPSFFVLPQFPFGFLFDGRFANLTLLVGISGAMIAICWIYSKSSNQANAALAIAWGILPFAVGHQLAAVGLLLLLLVFRYDLLQFQKQNRLVIALVVLSLFVSAGWFLYGIANRNYFASISVDWKASFREAFFGWPDFYSSTFSQWMHAMPLLTAVIFLSFLAILWFEGKKLIAELLRHPLVILPVFLGFCGVVNPLQSTTRYSFFLFPVVLISVVWAIYYLTGRFKLLQRDATGWTTALFLIPFALSNDFSPSHLFRIASYEVSYRTGPFRQFQPHWYYRHDFKSAADYVNSVSKPNEPLVISGRSSILIPHLNRPFVTYYPSWNLNLIQISRMNGTIHKWSSAPLYSSPEDLRKISKNETTVWLARRRDPGNLPRDFTIEEVWARRLVGYESAFVSPDNHVEIIKISLQVEE